MDAAVELETIFEAELVSPTTEKTPSIEPDIGNVGATLDSLSLQTPQELMKINSQRLYIWQKFIGTILFATALYSRVTTASILPTTFGLKIHHITEYTVRGH